MNKILKSILNKMEPISIKESVGIDAESEEKLKTSHYIITVIEAVVLYATTLGYDFCTKNGFIYLYNSQYWLQVRENEIKAFLKSAANKLGIDKYQSDYYVFVDQLLKQFYTSVTDLQVPEDASIKINLLNGTFEFGTENKLRGFKKEDFITYQLPFNYDKDAKAPLFEAYLNRVLPDKDTQHVLAEYIGYVFTNDFRHQKCLLLYGSGSNGKSVYFEIIRALIGKENVTSFSLKNLDDENSRALISNKLLNYSSEIDASISKDTFKQLCSGEPLQARLKYKDSFMMDKYAKLIFNCNELPKDVEHTHAYYRRFLIIPFTEIIPDAEQDKELANKIISAELSGVFNWVLEGLARLTKQGSFTESKCVAAALKEFKQEADSVFNFINDTGLEKVAECKMPLSPLYKQYDQFCKDNGFRILNIKNFRKRLESQDIEIKRLTSGNHVGLAKKILPPIQPETAVKI